MAFPQMEIEYATRHTTTPNMFISSSVNWCGSKIYIAIQMFEFRMRIEGWSERVTEGAISTRQRETALDLKPIHKING